MAAGPRNRSRTRPSVATSSYQRRSKAACDWDWSAWQTYPGSTHRTFYESMQDTVHAFPFGESPLNHYKWEGRPLTISGTCLWMDPGTHCVRVETHHTNTSLFGADYGNGNLGHANTGLTDDGSLYINEALAKGNPGTPTVDIAAFIAGLRDLPGTVRSLGRLSQAPIATSFGVIPTLSDVLAILSLTDDIAARQKQLQKLSQGTQKEHLSLAFRKVRDEWSSSSFHPHTGHRPMYKKETTRRVWAIKSHRIKTNPLKPPPKYDTSYVRRLLSSANTVATVWELLPWSWLVDYFVGIQSMINAANGNRVPGYEVSSLCVCVETKTHIDLLVKDRSTEWSGGTVHQGYVDVLTQKREIFSNPRPGFPRVKGYLTDHQLSIIGQLTLAMAGRR